MTRHRKGLRPLSQTGFHHLPANPGQRVPLEGGTKPKRTVLERFNETTSEERQLHATKGWRRLNWKRGRAQLLVAEIMSGQGRPLGLQRRFLVDGY